MMWLLFAVLLVFARHADCGALRCSEGSSCTAEEESKASPTPVPVINNYSQREAECQPGSEWESNCHNCKCSESGIAECLKQDACDKNSNAEPVRCKPNTTVERECNTCICLEDGLGLCTLKTCAKFERDLPWGDDCAPGTSWMNQCNHCWCEGGYGMCTLMGCYNHPEPERYCAPNSAWRKDCNICHCKDGRPVCTDLRCGRHTGYRFPHIHEENSEHAQRSVTQATLSRKIRAFQEVPKQCQPGQEFRLDCNKCLCDNEGQNFSCTRMDCNALNNHNGDAFSSRTKRETEKEEMKCVPGSVFDRECNVCRCSDEGQHAVCTMNRCAPPEGSTEGPAPGSRAGRGVQM